jgi:hypothetical protein
MEPASIGHLMLLFTGLLVDRNVVGHLMLLCTGLVDFDVCR